MICGSVGSGSAAGFGMRPGGPVRPWRQHSWIRMPVLAAGIAWAVSLAAGTAVLAGPACPDPFEVRQPDGTLFEAVRGGDEHFNWVSTRSLLVERGPDGYWRYLCISGGTSRPGDARVGLDAQPAGAATTDDLPALRHTSAGWQKAARAASRAATLSAAIAPPRPTEPLLVLLVEFSNRALVTTEAEWAGRFFGASGKSVRTYYQEASRGRFWFEPAAEVYGQADDGIVRVRLGYPHPDPGSTIGEANKLIVRDALLAAAAYVNFGAFDANRDGALSTSELHITTVVAGYDGGNTPPSVWGHRGWLYDAVAGPNLGGVIVADWYHGGSFVQVGELTDTHATPIGPICHELGHDLGLPDLYDVDGSSYGVGTHCLMGNGAWGAVQAEDSGTTPVLLSAWCRVRLGWLTPIIASGDGTYTLVQACDAAGANVLKILTGDPGQYFLAENRQPSGFDAGLQRAFQSADGRIDGGGIAIWHVDESKDNNDDEDHKLVDLEEADEAAAGGPELDLRINWGSRRHYFYPGNAAAFSDRTMPGSRLANGASTGISIGLTGASGQSMTLAVSASPSISISGRVAAPDGTGVGGVTLDGLPGSPVTDDSGAYTAWASRGWSGTVRPLVQGHAIDPPSRQYDHVTDSRTGDDYTVAPAAQDGGPACAAAGFGPVVLGTVLLPWLMRPRGRRDRQERTGRGGGTARGAGTTGGISAQS